MRSKMKQICQVNDRKFSQTLPNMNIQSLETNKIKSYARPHQCKVIGVVTEHNGGP